MPAHNIRKGLETELGAIERIIDSGLKYQWFGKETYEHPGKESEDGRAFDILVSEDDAIEVKGFEGYLDMFNVWNVVVPRFRGCNGRKHLLFIGLKVTKGARRLLKSLGIHLMHGWRAFVLWLHGIVPCKVGLPKILFILVEKIVLDFVMKLKGLRGDRT